MFARAFNLRQMPLLALVFLLVFSNCRSAEKFVERGDYDGAIDFTIQKLSGKKKKKTELVQGLELAFAKAQERDQAKISQLLSAGEPSNWLKVNELYRQMERRQNRVKPLVPLVATDGYMAEFAFIEVEKLENESRHKAANYLFAKAKSLLARAENTGDRPAAREAYEDLRRIENYVANYDGQRELLKTARELGTTHILFSMKNESFRILPIGLEDRLLEVGQRELNTEWRQFELQARPGIEYDYKVVFELETIDISPERVHERSYEEESRIEDGWEYVLDNKGNVKKDSCGNDIRVKKWAIIRARVLEIHQEKAARVAGEIKIFDRNGLLLDRDNLGAEVVFDHHAATFVGDRRALSHESLCKIGNSPRSFPSDSDMLTDAADRLKPDLRDELRRSRAIL